MGMLKYWLAHHLGKPPFAAWASGVRSASAVCCQASVEKLPATRCGMKIKSVAGDCIYARSNTAGLGLRRRSRGAGCSQSSFGPLSSIGIAQYEGNWRVDKMRAYSIAQLRDYARGPDLRGMPKDSNSAELCRLQT